MRINCPISSVELYKPDIRRLLLSVPEGEFTGFKAGQYLEMVLPQKNFPFSIANSPHTTGTIELHVKPTPDSEDSIVIEQFLDTADNIELEIPLGDCFIESTPDETLVLLAASTGITQMKSIFEYLVHLGHKMPVFLYWGVLAAKDLYLNDLCRGWEQSFPNLHYIPVVSEPETSPDWSGRTGLVGEAVLEDFDDLTDVIVYISGGPGMVYANFNAFVDRGMPEQNMFSDVFTYSPRQE